MKTWFGVLVFVSVVWIWSNYQQINELKADLNRAEDNSEYCLNSLSDYRDALGEANDNIEQCNSNIDDASGYAWSSYDDMGYMLENLETVQTVDEPNF